MYILLTGINTGTLMVFPMQLKYLFNQINLIYSTTQQLHTGEVKNFTMLLGIVLADVPDDYYGNFTVFPGTHHLLEKWFQDKGDIVKFTQATTFESNFSSILN